MSHGAGRKKTSEELEAESMGLNAPRRPTLPSDHDDEAGPMSTLAVARWLLAVGTLVVLAVYLADALHFSHYVNDDAYITLRYSRFLSMGRGPYFNPGEHVEGYTNFLLMLLLAPVIALGGEGAGPIVAKAIGVASASMSIIVAALLARRLAAMDDEHGIRAALCGIVAAGLVAASPAYALNSMSGLETSLFSFLLTCGVWLGVRSAMSERWMGAGIAFGAAALTRPEGPLFFAVYWGVQCVLALPRLPRLMRDVFSEGLGGLRRHPLFYRHLLPDAAIVVSIFAAHLVFRLIAYDGEWLPNTYYAKAGGFSKVGAWKYIQGGGLAPFTGTVGLSMGAGGLWFLGPSLGAIGLLLARSLRRGYLVPVLSVAVAGICLPFVTGTDWMLGWRMVVPFLPLAAVVVAIGWWQLACFLVRRPAWLGSVLLILVVPAAWLCQDDFRAYFYEHTKIRARGYETGHAALAEWLRGQAAKPGDTIAIMDIGIIGYRCIDQRILDITGLTDRVIARSPGKFMAKKYDVGYVLDQKPEFIVLVMTALGDPSRPIPPNTRLQFWMQTEYLIYNHPEFRKWYVKPQGAARVKARHWTERVASDVGAERIFEHSHPGQYYLLAVYRRQSLPTQIVTPKS